MQIQQDSAFPEMTAQQLNTFQLMRFMHSSIDRHLEMKIDPQSEQVLSLQVSAFMKQCEQALRGFPMSLEVALEAIFEASTKYVDELVSLLANPTFKTSWAQAPREKLLKDLQEHFADYLDADVERANALAHRLCQGAENWMRHVGRTCVGYVPMNTAALAWCVPPLRLH